MSNRNNKITWTIIITLAFAALITGLFVSQHIHEPKKLKAADFNGTLLQQPREVSDFSLQGIDKKVFSQENLKGQWTMIFFGFTSCGSVCPTTMAELGKTYRLLAKKEIKPLPQVVMISIDPKRDTLEKLAAYVHAFEPHFYAAKGNEFTVKKLTQEIGIAYAKIALSPGQDTKNYDIQHSGTVMLFNPEGKLCAFFTMPHQAKLMAQDYQLLVS